jgi:hypothetical protein
MNIRFVKRGDVLAWAIGFGSADPWIVPDLFACFAHLTTHGSA